MSADRKAPGNLPGICQVPSKSSWGDDKSCAEGQGQAEDDVAQESSRLQSATASSRNDAAEALLERSGTDCQAADDTNSGNLVNSAITRSHQALRLAANDREAHSVTHYRHDVMAWLEHISNEGSSSFLLHVEPTSIPCPTQKLQLPKTCLPLTVDGAHIAVWAFDGIASIENFAERFPASGIVKRDRGRPKKTGRFRVGRLRTLRPSLKGRVDNRERWKE